MVFGIIFYNTMMTVLSHFCSSLLTADKGLTSCFVSRTICTQMYLNPILTCYEKINTWGLTFNSVNVNQINLLAFILYVYRPYLEGGIMIKAIDV